MLNLRRFKGFFMDGYGKLSPNFRDIEKIGQSWGWFLLLGFILMLLGASVIWTAFSSTMFSIILFGTLLIGAGVVQILQAFLAQRWSGILLSLLLGILYIVTGFLCAAKPATAPIALNFWLAGFCLIVGIFKILASLLLRFEQWKWVLFNGVITFILGLSIYLDWPISGLWVIGLFVGVDMILSGWSWILLSLAAKKTAKYQ